MTPTAVLVQSRQSPATSLKEPSFSMLLLSKGTVYAGPFKRALYCDPMQVTRGLPFHNVLPLNVGSLSFRSFIYLHTCAATEESNRVFFFLKKEWVSEERRVGDSRAGQAMQKGNWPKLSSAHMGKVRSWTQSRF